MRRITIREAKQRFYNGQPIYLCPCKMRPGGPWNMAALVVWSEADRNSLMAWPRMLANWKFYNASYETGYYPHYYVEV